MEGFIATYTLIETRNNWKNNQHGGKAGSSTDHALVLLWNSLLESSEGAAGRGEAKAGVLCGVDFSKSFSRCSFQQILLAYKDLKAPQWIINMHAAFLTGRQMRVKVGNVLSQDIAVTGALYKAVYWGYSTTMRS